MPLALWVGGIFLVGYGLIAFEHALRLPRSAIALLTAVCCWGSLFLLQPGQRTQALGELGEHLAGIAAVVFFLLCALAIVQAIRVHGGFLFLTRWLRVRRLEQLAAVVSVVTFFLSAVIDNMTTTVVMIALVRELVPEQPELQKVLAGLIVIAANAGGAWTPIGDVTTTMLWLGGKIHAVAVVENVFVPSAFAIGVPLALLLPWFRRQQWQRGRLRQGSEPHAGTVFACGVGGLLFVPVFHTLTGLPPVLGAFFVVGGLWVLTELLHRDIPEREHLRMHSVLYQIDVSSLLFFVGILLAVDALQTAGILAEFARWLDKVLPAKELLVSLLGVVSAVVDNIPLTAACMKMYAAYPANHWLWMLLAYAVGTGGSLLVIGSAAGIVAMAAARVEFFWYLRRVAPVAALGYGAGIGAFLLMRMLLG